MLPPLFVWDADPVIYTPPPDADSSSLVALTLFLLGPTVVFDPLAPRTRSIRVGYLVEKLLLTVVFCVLLGQLDTQYVRPGLCRLGSVPWVASLNELLLPSTATFGLIFLIAFECLANCAAELTRQGRRAFYSSWWDSTNYSAFSRSWNVVIGEFLAMEVYGPLKASWGTGNALSATYLLSAVVHEAVLWAVLAPSIPLPVLSICMAAQMPLVRLQRSAPLHRTRLGSYLLLASLCVGLALNLIAYTVMWQIAVHGRPGC